MLQYGTIDTALVFLKENKSCRIGDLLLGIDDDGDIFVTGWSAYLNFENITKPIALKELQETKGLFHEMLISSAELQNFIKGKIVKFNLCYDDSGKGGILICTESNGIINWNI